MRPKLLALCAVSSLLAAAAHSACAQSGPLNSTDVGLSSAGIAADNPIAPASVPPLISSGRAAASQPTLSGSPPTSSFRDEPLRNDQSWTRSPQVGSSPTTQSAIVPASGAVLPVRGQSDTHSYVSQAQFTSSDPVPSKTLQRQPTTASTDAEAKEPRALKPPTSVDPATQNKRSSGTAQMIVSVGSSLLIVIGLLLGAAWCYRKASPNSSGSLPKQVIQVLGRTPLAPRQQLILVRFGPKLLLLSNLQGEVRTISEIVDPLEVDRVAGLCESSQAGSISDSFRNVLHNIGRTG